MIAGLFMLRATNAKSGFKIMLIEDELILYIIYIKIKCFTYSFQTSE